MLITTVRLELIYVKGVYNEDLISDLIGRESGGKGDLAINSEEILRAAFKGKKTPKIFKYTNRPG